MSKIYLEVSGKKYEGFTDIAVNSSIENFCSSFSFSTTVKEKISFLGKRTGQIVNNIMTQYSSYIRSILLNKFNTCR